MRPALRIGAVLVASASWILVSSVFLFWLGIGEARFNPETRFSDALADAQTDAWRGEPQSPLPSVCGFPAPDTGSFELSHAAVVSVARCLERSGHLRTEDLMSIESATFAISAACAEVEDAGTVLGGKACTYAYTNTHANSRWWLRTAITVAGLPVIVWLVGFRIPWQRRRVSSTG